ncbi:MAG: GatB/YqeY domain-containing protein [Candidatus Puniceispirillaceae bacterium]
MRTAISNAQKQALKAKDKTALSTIRLITAALKDRDIAARSKGVDDGISDDEILSMLQTMIKQRAESVKLYTEGNRPELAAAENEEIRVIQQFLPQQLSAEELEAAITKAISDSGAESVKDMGKVMGVLKANYAGQIDFGAASGEVKNRLMQKG